MRLEVKNIGKISHAEIDMQGLTVIVGNNSTGKSTISKSMYAVVDGFHDFNGKISKRRKEVLLNNLSQWSRMVITDLKTIYNKNKKTVTKEMNMVIKSHIDLFDRFSNRYVYTLGKNDRGEQEEFNFYEWMESEITFRQKIVVLFSLDELKDVLLNVEGGFMILERLDDTDKIYEKIKKESEEQKISKEILNRTVQDCFSNKFSTQFNGNATEVRLYPKKENKDQYARIYRKKGMENVSYFSYMDFQENIIYIQPMHILDARNDFWMYKSGADSIQDKLLSQLGKEECMEAIEEQTQKNVIKAKIDTILSEKDEEFDNEPIGDAQKDERPFYTDSFIYKDEQLAEMINFKDVASGIKNIAMIKRLITNGVLRKSSLLIIDEPEVNLHPDWQMKLAEILVMLRKEMQITILINTHSPYFMRALECYSDIYGIFDELNVYCTVRDKETDHQYEVENISEVENGIEYLYYQMSKPFAKLQEMLENKRAKNGEEDDS